jgi:hypothetical protein
MRAGGQTDGRTGRKIDMTKSIFAVRNFANEHKNITFRTRVTQHRADSIVSIKTDHRLYGLKERDGLFHTVTRNSEYACT